MEPTKRPRHRAVTWLAAAAAVTGVGFGAAGLASAASSDSSSSTVAVTSDTVAPADTAAPSDPVVIDSSTTPLAPPDGGQPADPAALPNGPGETVLTGDEAAKVTAAALAAEPGATVIRVETDSSGHTYEAHITKADGTQATLYFDASYNPDGSDVGFGPGPKGNHPGGPRHGQATDDQAAADAGTSNG